MTATLARELGSALATDYFLLREQFDDAEWEPFLRTRRFVGGDITGIGAFA